MRLLATLCITLSYLSTQARSLGEDQFNQAEVLGNDSPWSPWMNIKAPPVSYLKPKTKGLPLEAPWTSWMKQKVQAPVATNYLVESPWITWTNLKLANANPVTSKFATILSPSVSKINPLKTDFSTERQVETESDEETLLVKWAKRIYNAQNNPLALSKNKTAILESAWSEWQKLHNESFNNFQAPKPQATEVISQPSKVDSEVKKESLNEEIATALEALGVQPAQISKIITASPDEIAMKLTGLGLSPQTVTEVLTSSPKVITTELLKLGILPPKVIEIMKVPSGALGNELENLGIPPEKVRDILTPPPEQIKESLSKLQLSPNIIEDIFTATPEAIVAKLQLLGIPSLTNSNEILMISASQEKVVEELKTIGLSSIQISDILTPLSDTIITDLQILGVPLPEIAEILTPSLESISDKLQTLGMSPSEILEVLKPSTSTLTTELFKIGIPSTKIAQILTAPPKEIASKLEIIGVPQEKISEIVFPPPEAIAKQLQALGIPTPKVYEIALSSSASIPAQLQQIGISPEAISAVLEVPIEKIKAKLEQLMISPDKIENILAAPVSSIVAELEKLEIPPSKISEIITASSKDISVTLNELGLSPSTISYILTPPRETIAINMVKLGIPIEKVSEILTASPEQISSKLSVLGFPPSLVSDITSTPPLGPIPEQISLVPSMPTILQTLETNPALEKFTVELEKLGIPLESIKDAFSQPPYTIGVELEKLGIPPQIIAEILTTSPPEINIPKLQQLGLPATKISELLYAPETAMVKLYDLGIPMPDILEILSPSPEIIAEKLLQLGLPSTKVVEILTPSPEVITEQLTALGIPPNKLEQIAAAIVDETKVFPPVSTIAKMFPPSVLQEIRAELGKVGLTPAEVSEILDSPISAEAIASKLENFTESPEIVQLTIPQLKSIVEIVLEECKKTSKYVRRTHAKKHSKPKANTEDNKKRALYPISLSPEESTTKNPFHFISQEMWDLVPSVAPNTTIVDPGYWAAKKSIFISKLFDALARVTMNYTNSATTETPKQQLMKKIDTMLLSDAARSVKSDDSEEMSTRDEDLIDSEEPENLPKEPDNPLHKLFKFGVQKTILSDATTTMTPPTTPMPAILLPTIASNLDQQKVILDKLQKLYKNARVSYKKSKNKSKHKKPHGSTTTVSPIDFEELAKALMVEPTK